MLEVGGDCLSSSGRESAPGRGGGKLWEGLRRGRGSQGSRRAPQHLHPGVWPLGREN